jgi:hypothetical protein
MERINNPSGLPSRPDSVVLPELAIAAGIAGNALAVCFNHFPGIALSELCGYFIRGVTTPAALRVRGRRELKILEERMETIRLVLVDSEKMLAETQWAIQMELTRNAPGDPLPTVLCTSPLKAPEALPGAIVMLNGTETEMSAVTRWRRHADAADPVSIEVQAPQRVELAPSVSSALTRFERGASPSAEQVFQAEQVLRGLLAGASLLRSAQDRTTGSTNIIVCPDDYRFVRERLQRPIVGSTDLECDPLAVDMVHRMNVYLKIRFGLDTSPDDPIWTSAEEYMQLDRRDGRKQPVTRREVADLGNTKSGLVRRLVASLKRAHDGYRQFGRLGLVGHPPTESDWSRSSPAALSRHLKPWSAKQVRTHFETLEQRNLVTASKQHNNGPWRYELPEALATNGSPFAALPALEE